MATKDEAAVQACYSTWSTNYYRDYYGEGASYPPVHSRLLKNLLRDAGVRNVLDAGCGPASFLRELADANLELYGFDLTPEMVVEAQRVFRDELQLPPEHVWQGSVRERSSYQPRGHVSRDGFDATVCVGVLPHIPPAADVEVMTHLRDSVRRGGLVALEARNQLFALFTLNRYSHDFFTQELIRSENLLGQANGDARALHTALEQLQHRFRMDLPPTRKGKSGEPGYDEVLSRTHNPLVLREQFAAVGFNDVRVLFYHYHCLPPMLESLCPGLFRAASLQMEDPDDWRGHFMASAFIVTGRRA